MFCVEAEERALPIDAQLKTMNSAPGAVADLVCVMLGAIKSALTGSAGYGGDGNDASSTYGRSSADVGGHWLV